MQQAARVADRTAFFTALASEQTGDRTGVLVEYDKTTKIFENPSDKRTEDYISGRFWLTRTATIMVQLTAYGGASASVAAVRWPYRLVAVESSTSPLTVSGHSSLLDHGLDLHLYADGPSALLA